MAKDMRTNFEMIRDELADIQKRLDKLEKPSKTDKSEK